MLEYFVFGTFWFWAICGLDFLALMIFVNQDKGFASFASLIVGIVFLNWIGQIPVFPFMFQNPKIFFMYILGYIIIGVFWSFIKYYFHLLKLREEYNRYKESNREWRKPSFKDTAEDITMWMSFWPFSLLWTTLHDFCIRIFETIKMSLSGCYRRMYNHIFPAD